MIMNDNIEQPNRQYFNDAQYYALAMNTRDEVIVAGRGVGSRASKACPAPWAASWLLLLNVVLRISCRQCSFILSGGGSNETFTMLLEDDHGKSYIGKRLSSVLQTGKTP